MTLFDHVLFAILALASPLVERFWIYPSLVRASASGSPGARSRWYAFGIVSQWTFAALVLAAWVRLGRGWSGLALGPSTPARLSIGFAIAALYVGVAWRTRRKLISRPDRLERLRGRLESATALIPRTTAERRGFALLSITAGVCEELLYRGFVTWYLAQATSPVLAVLASSLLFGFAHVYLGSSHVVRTSVVGALFAGIVALSGSLAPAMVIHAAMDLLAGDLGHRALAGRRPEAQVCA